MEITKSTLLAVQGKDEEIFFRVLLKELKIPDVQIVSVLGKDNFKTQLKTLKTTTGFHLVKKLALVRDADNNAKSAFISLKNILKELNMPVPEAIGQFATSDKISCGIYIMPCYPSTGMLENLCLQSVEQTPDFDCIEELYNCINNKPDNLAKSKVQIYLALQNPIVNSVGLGAEKKYWNFEHNCFNELKHFLEQMR